MALIMSYILFPAIMADKSCDVWSSINSKRGRFLFIHNFIEFIYILGDSDFIQSTANETVALLGAVATGRVECRASISPLG